MTKVKFINAELHKQCPQFFPIVGTIGTVIANDNKGTLIVEWERGTTSDFDIWSVAEADTEEVADEGDEHV